MTMQIETPQGVDALTEFVQFADQVYAYRTAAWPASVDFQLPLLTGASPYAQDRQLRPFLARQGDQMVARAVAVVDERYNRHWQERLGHIIMFEALPEPGAATSRLLDAACDWLAAQGMTAVRAGFGLLDFPFALDEYAALPPPFLQQNPAYYHRLLKDARFESEMGFVDYRIAVRPELLTRWADALAAAQRAGYELIPLQELPEKRRVPEFTAAFNDAFKHHWGMAPSTIAEFDHLFAALTPAGMLATSLMAYRAGLPVGVLFVLPELTATAALRPGRVLDETEKLNYLAIGVCESDRGRGLNLAMAAHAYLELARRGARYLSYTLVLDDNWPSRRTAEKLGATVCANYIVYRRNFRQQK